MMTKPFIDMNRNNFLVMPTTPAQLALAEQEFEGRFRNGNTMNGKTVYDRKNSRMAGILGEIVFADFMGNMAVRASSVLNYSACPYDFLVDGHIRVDVKCKMRTVPPKHFFEASMFEYQEPMKEEVDVYVFLSTIPDMSLVWFCGMCTSLFFHNNAMLWKAGDVDKSNGKVFDEDTLSLRYSQLEVITRPEDVLDMG